MKAVRAIESKRVFHLFADDVDVYLGERLEAPGVMAIDINSQTHEIVYAASPEEWVGGGVLVFDDTWSVANQEAYDSHQQAKAENQAATVRAERNKRLSESDWTQVADAPVDKAAWATYRQALRDITAQTGFPWDVQWPQSPN